jgi:hypothetical protein
VISQEGGEPARSPADAGPGRSAEYRYGVVLLLAFILVVFAIVAPDADWARAVAMTLEGAALLVAVATSRARSEVRRARALAVCAGALLLVIVIALGLLPVESSYLLLALVAALIPLALIGGLVRLIRDRGVILPAVAGAIAIYLLLGLLFASVIGFVSHVDDTPYFSQGTDVSGGDRVYFSFTVLTTTGFGDFTAATSVGHALAVVEMLLGQLYLVTVIGILVGNLARQRR